MSFVASARSRRLLARSLVCLLDSLPAQRPTCCLPGHEPTCVCVRPLGRARWHKLGAQRRRCFQVCTRNIACNAHPTQIFNYYLPAAAATVGLDLHTLPPASGRTRVGHLRPLMARRSLPLLLAPAPLTCAPGEPRARAEPLQRRRRRRQQRNIAMRAEPRSVSERARAQSS